MKQLLTFLIFSSLFFINSIETQAQLYLGGGLTYGTEISKLGLNFRGAYEIDEKFIAAPGVNFFFKNKLTNNVSVNYFSIDLDVRYNLIEIAETTMVYPLGGINIFRGNVKGTTTGSDLPNTGTKIGLDLGLGAQIISQTSDLNYFGEFKYTVGGINQITLTAGVLYGF